MRLTPGIGRSAALLLVTACLAAGCASPGDTSRPATVASTAPDLGIIRLPDASDRAAAREARAAALDRRRPGEQALWRNHDSGNTGSVTPLDAFDDAQGRSCRHLQHVFTIEGTADQANGTACRQPDGTWIAVAE